MVLDIDVVIYRFQQDPHTKKSSVLHPLQHQYQVIDLDIDADPSFFMSQRIE
jgi:hypothetical protein